MTHLAQSLAVAGIGLAALVYLLRRLHRRLKPQPAAKAAGCGSCSGCACGGCPATRR